MALLIITENPVILESINAQSLSKCQLSEEAWMHSWIKENYQIFFGKLNYEIIGREINVTGSGSEGYLDFLAIDLATGNTVIIEAKRDDYKHRDLLGQSIEYAAGVSKFDKDRLNEMYQAYSGTIDNTIDELFAQQSYPLDLINQKQQIILVVQKSLKNQGSLLRLKSSCAFLRAQGLDINILEISWYTNNLDYNSPTKGDIIELNFVWELDMPENSSKKMRSSSSVPASEDEFLVDKSDMAIELYRAVVNMLDGKRIKYKRQPTSAHITLYGKKKAFLVIQFYEEHIMLRLRLPDDYSNTLLDKLNQEYDKLSKSDNFLYQAKIMDINLVDDLADSIIYSYEYNS